MGLNIYFCDVCGVRVTDVDLRSGHGMRQYRDVICATCLEIGHGKEWLASRGLQAQAIGATPRTMAADMAVVDAGRDRAQTVPDSRAVGLPEDDSDPTATGHPSVRGAVIPRTHVTDFAGAAAGFAALGQQPAALRADDDGHLAEESSDDLDPALLGHAAAMTSDEHPASAFRTPVDEDESSPLINVKERATSASTSGKAPSEVPRSGASVAPSAQKGSTRFIAGSGKRPSTPSQTKGSGTKQTRTSSPRAGKGKDGKGGMPLPLKLSLVTIPLILLIAFFSIGPAIGHAKPADVHDMAAQKAKIDGGFMEAAAMVNAAIDSHDVAKMRAARERWINFQHEWELFTIAAKQWSNWTEDDCDRYWDGVLRAHDVQGRIKLLNDEIAKQSLGH